MAFLTAFAKSAGEEAGMKLGPALVDYIADQIKAWRSRSSDEQSAALENVATATAKISAATPELTAAISHAVAEALASALGQEAESDIAGRIAARVHDEALKVIAGGASG
jgi:cell wall assembly regulator SMI1